MYIYIIYMQTLYQFIRVKGQLYRLIIVALSASQMFFVRLLKGLFVVVLYLI